MRTTSTSIVSRRLVLSGLLVGVFLLACCNGAALGASFPAPAWTLEAFASPSVFTTEENALCEGQLTDQLPPCDEYVVKARDAGDAALGAGVTLKDVIPAGLTVRAAELRELPGGGSFGGECRSESGMCGECRFTAVVSGTTVECPFSAMALAPDEELVMTIAVTTEEAAKPLVDTAQVEGGGAPPAETSVENSLGPEIPGFGLEAFHTLASGPDGSSETQAGGHPYEVTFTLGLNTKFREGPGSLFQPESVQDVRDVVVDLPAGLVGSVLAAPQCTFAQLSSHIFSNQGGCPPDTIIGHLRTEPTGEASVDGPIYNMVPEPGYPAEFAVIDSTGSPHVFYSQVVPSPKGYVLQAINPELPQAELRSIVATFYGDPAAKNADAICGLGNELKEEDCREGFNSGAVPFFTDPTSCSGEVQAVKIYLDSWQNPARFNPGGTPANLEEAAWVKAESALPPVTGCNLLQFPAEISVRPSTQVADAPTGMNFQLKVSQPEKVGVLATASLRSARVTLPVGLSVNPAAGDGLSACSEGQIGWLGGSVTNFNAATPQCPASSRIATLEVTSPLLAGAMQGEVFLAAQNANPFGSRLAAYVVVNDPATGVLVKLPGKLSADGKTGQLTAEFVESPEVPFSSLDLHFFTGPRASLATPGHCGTFSTNTTLTPWSSNPETGPFGTPSDSFSISESCAAVFTPAFSALSDDVQAGGYSTLEAAVERSDGEEALAGISITLPQGLLAKIKGVSLCTDQEIHEAEATQPDEETTWGCSEASQVGTVTAAAGPGPNPLQVSGRVFLTGPYKGGPYGLAVIVPAVAGPYRLGAIVVRQSLRIDPRTAQATDVSDPFPSVVDGIPVRTRRVRVSINRPEFAFNPSSCARKQFTGTILGAPLEPSALNLAANGEQELAFPAEARSTSSFTAPFAVTNCAALKFTPKIAVTTKAKASKRNGLALHFAISYPAGTKVGEQSWFEETKIDLPKQISSRDETIQKACIASVFESNRAACPAASKIGSAIVRTQVLPDPLQGPVYFVSHGGAKFPEVIFVLQGNNLTIELHGETFINGKTGITSATFRNTPDTPFESLEVTLPAGRFSEFGANLPAKAKYNFCGQKLRMPTRFKAQDGQVITRSTPIGVTGCPKHTKHSRRKRNTRRKER
jgi:hypothetical protein